MNRQWWFVGGIVAVIVILIGAGWSVRERFLPVEVGTAAPNFTARDLQGHPVDLKQLRGQVVLLNIWATWCPPCREEMPSLQRLYSKMGPKGLKLVAVSVDAAPGSVDPDGRPGGDVASFARSLGLTFDIWRDPDGSIEQLYRTTGVPESFVIDRDGTIIKKVIGGTLWDSSANLDLLNRLLQE
ncbi:MAG TPA: TlpA disulfide reductase family protein [Longimicrobiaceae bacterium]|nr:TlpA disulfide reductase family protein [Longimicrobiaceae bacterium]